MGPKRARLVGTKSVARDTLLLSFQAVEPEAVAFRAGQFISILLGEDGAKRSYSLASTARRTDGFDLLVKLVAKGRASHALETLPVGQEIRYLGPLGYFVLDASHPGDVVFCATGSGIAPVIPMLEELLARPAPTRVHLFFGLRHDDELVFAERLQELAAGSQGRLAISIHVSQPGPAWTGTAGRITGPVLAVVPSLRDPVFYLVGNGDMVKQLKTELQALGVERKRQIRTEAFTPATPGA